MLDLVSPLDFVVIVAICGSRELPNYEIEKFQTCGEQGKFARVYDYEYASYLINLAYTYKDA